MSSKTTLFILNATLGSRFPPGFVFSAAEHDYFLCLDNIKPRQVFYLQRLLETSWFNNPNKTRTKDDQLSSSSLPTFCRSDAMQHIHHCLAAAFLQDV